MFKKIMNINFILTVFLTLCFVVTHGQHNPYKPPIYIDKQDLHFLFGDDVPSNYSVVNIRQNSRKRRAIISETLIELPGYIDLTLEDETGEVELELHPNLDLIAPNFKVVLRGKDGDIIKETKESPQIPCIYVGNAKGKPSTSAALSSCDGKGFTGVLIDGDHSHLIRPLRKTQSRPKRDVDGLWDDENMTPDGLHIIHSRTRGSKCALFNFRAMMAPRVQVELSPNETIEVENWIKEAARKKRDTVLDPVKSFANYYGDYKRFFQDDHQIWKRKISNSKYLIETAVFVDDDMYKHVKKKENDNVIPALKSIVLAIMNGVYIMYNAPSLRTDISLSLIRLDIWQEQPKDLDKGEGEIDRYLANFCQWQKKQNQILNPDGDSNPDHWDHGILLSGLDLWEGSKEFKSVIGLAWVAGMCTKSYSCTINEGTSFEAVYVISHEMGHNLNMSHDGSQEDGNNCPSDIYLMSPSTGPGKVTWSVCSNRELEDFLSKRDGSFCLLDVAKSPNEIEVGNEGSPGQVYGVKKQCSFALGDNFTPYVTSKNPYDNVCRELWCQNKTHALRIHPALEGSSCGDGGKLCISGGCVTKSSDIPNAPNAPGIDISSNEIPTSKPKDDTAGRAKNNPGFATSFRDLFLNIRDMFNKYLFAAHHIAIHQLALWTLANLTECSAGCGGGWQTGTVVCKKGSSTEVLPDSDCKGEKPPIKTTCNTLPCIVH